MELNAKTLLVATNKEGFLVDRKVWTPQIAKQLAEINNIVLQDAHWEIIHFIRDYYEQFQFLPNTRQFIKAIAVTLGENKGNSRYLHSLFPAGPLKYACKLAGLPKPPTCL